MSEREVLHILQFPTAQSEELAAVLAGLNVPRREVPDCYLALAHVARQGPEKFSCVLAALPGLTPGDGEFFRLLSRRFRGLPAYVHGPESGEATIGWAIEQGARGAVDAAGLRELLAAPRLASPAPEPPLPGREAGPRSPQADLAGPIQAAAAIPRAPRRRRRRQGAAGGNGPAARREAQPPEPPPPRPAASQEPEAPLLSAEELEALLGEEPPARP